MAIYVVKFGGSVLESEASLHRAVAEVYRYVRDGHKIIAVCSAFKGQTDKLLRLAGSYTQAASSSATPSLVATGEVMASCLMAMAAECIALRLKSGFWLRAIRLTPRLLALIRKS
jgi:homoserine dehydrogenase